MRRVRNPEPRQQLGAIHLGSAVVRTDELEDEPVEWWTQVEAEAALGVSDRTLRNWAEIGLPVRKGPHGRPIYPADDCRLWAECWRDVTADCQRYKRPAPTSLTLLQALNWRALKRSVDGLSHWSATRVVAALGVAWLDVVVIVPNDCDGWGRTRALRLAVEGIASEERHPHPADEQLLADHGVPRGYSRRDLGWPCVPDQAVA
jgi:hypothetical protein